MKHCKNIYFFKNYFQGLCFLPLRLWDIFYPINNSQLIFLKWSSRQKGFKLQKI